MNFKHGDIVVSEQRGKKSSALIPDGSIVQVRDCRVTREGFSSEGDTFLLEAIDQFHSIYVSHYLIHFGSLRLANRQEQFLYYILGPHMSEKKDG